jgi:hypothetical protein
MGSPLFDGPNQSGVQTDLRSVAGGLTYGSYEEDWHLLINVKDPSVTGSWNERVLRYVNDVLFTAYDNLPQALDGMAKALGFPSWSETPRINVAIAFQALKWNTLNLQWNGKNVGYNSH